MRCARRSGSPTPGKMKTASRGLGTRATAQVVPSTGIYRLGRVDTCLKRFSSRHPHLADHRRWTVQRAICRAYLPN